MIAHDKLMHFAVGACIAAPITVFNPILAMAAVTVAAIGKEAYDYISNKKVIAAGGQPQHGVEVMDAVATVLGGAIVAVPAFFTLVGSMIYW